jgi:hypothetical protein
MKTQTLTRGLANYTDERDQFHKCFAVSNGETFVFWFGGIYINNPFIKASFEESDSVSLHHYAIVQPQSKECYEQMEKHFDLCVALSQMEWPNQFATFGFEDSEHMMDLPQFGEEYERMHIFHHNEGNIHAVFGDPLDGGFGFVNLMIGAIGEAIEEIMEEQLQAEAEELEIEKELDSYKGLLKVSGEILLNMGFANPKCSAECHVFYEYDGGVSQLLQDQYGNLHVFDRHGNDIFGYRQPFAEWLSKNAQWLIQQQKEYMQKAQMFQSVIQELALKS